MHLPLYKKIYLKQTIFFSKEPIYNSDKIVLKQYFDMFNIGFV